MLKALARTRFATAEARLAAGEADERERRLATRALAIAAICMYVAAVATAIATMFGLEPQASLRHHHVRRAHLSDHRIRHLGEERLTGPMTPRQG